MSANFNQIHLPSRSRFKLSYRQQVVAALVVLLILDYADRGLIGGLGPTLERSFGMNDAQLGYLSSASMVISGLATLPLGIVIDRAARLRLLMLCLIVWTVALTLTGAATSFGVLVGAQVMVGVVGAATGPAVPSLVGDLTPIAERGDILGLVNGGPVAGTGVGIVLAAAVTAFASFRWCFWLLAIGAALLAIVFSRLREPARTGGDGLADPSGEDQLSATVPSSARMIQLLHERRVEPDARAVLDVDALDMSLWEIAKYVVRVRTDLIVLICRAIGDYFFTGVASFGVVFATQQYGVSERYADGALIIIGLGAMVGFMAGGRTSDVLLMHGHLNSRVWVAIAGYLLAPVCLLPALLIHSLLDALPLLALSGFFLAATAPALDAIRIDVIVPRARGRAESIREVLRTVSEGAGPLLFGLISVSFGTAGFTGLQIAFISGLPVVFIAGLVLALRTYQPDVVAALVSVEKRS